MAASQKQVDANRRNAQNSTGPKTEEGKTASRTNATTHGLTAATTIYQAIRHENPAEFHEMRQALMDDWAPVGTKEQLAVEMLAASYKRIQRAEGFEANFFTGAMESVQQHNGKPVTKAKSRQTDDFGCGIVIGQSEHKLTWENLDRYRRNAWLDYNRTVEQLRRLQKDRIDGPDRELRAETHRLDYLRRTTAPPVETRRKRTVLAGSGLARRLLATKMGSFRRLYPAPSTPAPDGQQKADGQRKAA